MADAQRCLECGCHDYFECKLVHYANQYRVAARAALAGDVNRVDYEDDHPFILRGPQQVHPVRPVRAGVRRGHGRGRAGAGRTAASTRWSSPPWSSPLAQTDCISCGQCVSVCPTGALGERLSLRKSVPLETQCTDTTCSFCSVGCSMHLETGAGMLLKAVPDKEGAVNKGLLCAKGRFGFDCAELDEPVLLPLMKMDGTLEEASYQEAAVRCAKGLESAAARHGKDAVAVAVSPASPTRRPLPSSSWPTPWEPRSFPSTTARAA